VTGLVQEDVGGLEIAVDEALLVDVAERAADLDEDLFAAAPALVGIL
jgi:hypothetical protein